MIICSRTEKDEETGLPLYWNNDEGWVDKNSATNFDNTDGLMLPVGGYWVDNSHAANL